MNLNLIINAVEDSAVPPVKFGEDSIYPDYDWYQFLGALVERKCYVPENIKKQYIEAIMMDEEFTTATAEESAEPEAWEALRKFARLDPPVQL